MPAPIAAASDWDRREAIDDPRLDGDFHRRPTSHSAIARSDHAILVGVNWRGLGILPSRANLHNVLRESVVHCCSSRVVGGWNRVQIVRAGAEVVWERLMASFIRPSNGRTLSRRPDYFRREVVFCRLRALRTRLSSASILFVRSASSTAIARRGRSLAGRCGRPQDRNTRRRCRSFSIAAATPRRQCSPLRRLPSPAFASSRPVAMPSCRRSNRGGTRLPHTESQGAAPPRWPVAATARQHRPSTSGPSLSS